MNITEFKDSIKHKDVEHNRTYLYTTYRGCKYGQSYDNAIHTLEFMINNFVSFYYPYAEEAGENKRIYSLKKDHAEIKKQIKEWETKINEIVYCHNTGIATPKDILNTLEVISHEMTAVNI